MADKTNYAQCLTHMIKGNLGAGILAMPASFAHTGLVGAGLGLPLLCLISTYCVHLLVRSARRVEQKSQAGELSQEQVNYAKLTRVAFDTGPQWARSSSQLVCRAVDTCLLMTQIGVCCIYVIFVVENVTLILASYQIFVHKTMVFLAIFPVALLLSFIKTLARLSVASLIANLLQAIGLALIVEFLLRDVGQLDLSERDNFRPLDEMALGFGSVMFAFEGISVVLPLYARMRRPELMGSRLGVVNVSYLFILILYFIMGLLGYLKFGQNVRDSITLNLPATPLYDMVRAMFTASILLSYPLQFYVPNEIIWNWAKKNLLKPVELGELESKAPLEDAQLERAPSRQPEVQPCKCQPALTNFNKLTTSPINQVADLEGAPPGARFAQNLADFQAGLNERRVQEAAVPAAKKDSTKENLIASPKGAQQHAPCCPDDNLSSSSSSSASCATEPHSNLSSSSASQQRQIPASYEYYCRLIIVILTFTLAMSVPKLNLLMDLIGSFSGAALCLTIPALIHLVAFWDETKGTCKVLLILVDGFLIITSISAGLAGSLSSLVSIVRSFHY